MLVPPSPCHMETTIYSAAAGAFAPLPDSPVQTPTLVPNDITTTLSPSLPRRSALQTVWRAMNRSHRDFSRDFYGPEVIHEENEDGEEWQELADFTSEGNIQLEYVQENGVPQHNHWPVSVPEEEDQKQQQRCMLGWLSWPRGAGPAETTEEAAAAENGEGGIPGSSWEDAFAHVHYDGAVTVEWEMEMTSAHFVWAED